MATQEQDGGGVAVATRPEDGASAGPVTRMGGGSMGLLRPIASPEEVLAVQNQTRELLKKTLVEGRDYGTPFPSTKANLTPAEEAKRKKQRTLLKPGAERINAAFGVVAYFRIIEQEIDHDRPVEWEKVKSYWDRDTDRRVHRVESAGTSKGLYRYVVACDLYQGDRLVGQGIGSASTMESKYIDRPRDLENTVLKIGKKRSFVDATLTTYGLSDEFTQDLEDDEDEDAEQRSARAQAKATDAVGRQVQEAEARLRDAQQRQRQQGRPMGKQDRQAANEMLDKLVAAWDSLDLDTPMRMDDARVVMIDRDVPRRDDGVPDITRLSAAELQEILDHVNKRIAERAARRTTDAGSSAPAVPGAKKDMLTCRKVDDVLHLLDPLKDKTCIGCGTGLAGQRTATAVADPKAYCKRALQEVDRSYAAERVPDEVLAAGVALGAAS